MRALKVLLMYLFVTPLINKISCSDNQQFLFNILKSKNKGDFLTGSTFCTFELKSIIQKWLSQDALSKVHLNKYGSYFKFILLLSGEIKLSPGPTTLTRNDRLWEVLPFLHCSFSNEWMDYQLDSIPEIYNDIWNMFQKGVRTSFTKM